jgi:hypothetical protein
MPIQTGIDKLQTQPKTYDQESMNNMIGKLNRLLSQLNSAIGNSGPFRTGSGAPGNNAGSQGDIYYDYTNHVIYGPLTSNGWGNGIPIG